MEHQKKCLTRFEGSLFVDKFSFDELSKLNPLELQEFINKAINKSLGKRKEAYVVTSEV